MNWINKKMFRNSESLASNQKLITVIKPKVGWQVINFKELKEYGDLFFFLVWRDIKVIYAQTILGFLWAIFHPVLQIVIFAVVFGEVTSLGKLYALVYDMYDEEKIRPCLIECAVS